MDSEDGNADSAAASAVSVAKALAALLACCFMTALVVAWRKKQHNAAERANAPLADLAIDHDAEEVVESSCNEASSADSDSVSGEKDAEIIDADSECATKRTALEV
jgi:hypothetical protein